MRGSYYLVRAVMATPMVTSNRRRVSAPGTEWPSSHMVRVYSSRGSSPE